MVKPKLVWHIGLPKCGTTTLQEHVFGELPNYLGKFNKHSRHAQEPGIQAMMREIRRAVWHEPSAYWDSETGRRTTQHLMASCESALEHDDVVVMSDEGLTALPLFSRSRRRLYRSHSGSTSPIAAHLATLLPKVQDLVETRLVVTIRRQPDLLASLYAQSSDHIPWPGQRHFERHVAYLTTRQFNDPTNYTNYDWLISQLQSVVDPSNLTVLLLEEIGTRQWWADLGSTLEWDDATVAQLVRPAPRENTRSSHPATWNLRPYRYKALLHDRFARMDPTNARNEDVASRGRLAHLRELSAIAERRLISLATNRIRADSITVAPPLRARLTERYDACNRACATRLGREFENWGYHG